MPPRVPFVTANRPRARLALASLLAAAALLAGCGKNDSAPAAASPEVKTSATVSLETIESTAKGFSVGPAMSARVVYVFFDAQCPHCGELWEFAKPVKQARFVWIPVSLLNANSTAQGAAILAAPDPIAAMEGHEQALRAQRGGILAQGDLEAQKAALKKNTELFNSYSFNSVPMLVTKNAQTGVVVTHSGALPAPELAAWAGVSTQ